jgi:hypothetical protein
MRVEMNIAALPGNAIVQERASERGPHKTLKMFKHPLMAILHYSFLACSALFNLLNGM